MKRREMIKAVLVGGALTALRPAGAAENEVGARITSITGPDHPFAPKKTLVYGLGETAAAIMRKSLDDDFIGDFWSMWAGIPNTAPEADVDLWGTDLYPFSERNMTTLSILTRLGDRGADLVAPTTLAWRDRVPVEVLFLDPEDEAAADVSGLAARQLETLSALRGVGLVRLGRTEADAIRFLEIRSGWNPPEDV